MNYRDVPWGVGGTENLRKCGASYMESGPRVHFLSIQSILFNEIKHYYPTIETAVYCPGSLLFRELKLHNRTSVLFMQE